VQTRNEVRARLDAQRYDALAEKDLVSKQQRDTADANWKMASGATGKFPATSWINCTPRLSARRDRRL